MDLLADLVAFLAEHPSLDGGVEGAWVRVLCEWGAELIRRAGED